MASNVSWSRLNKIKILLAKCFFFFNLFSLNLRMKHIKKRPFLNVHFCHILSSCSNSIVYTRIYFYDSGASGRNVIVFTCSDIIRYKCPDTWSLLRILPQIHKFKQFRILWRSFFNHCSFFGIFIGSREREILQLK